jgi:Phosphofructokinase
MVLVSVWVADRGFALPSRRCIRAGPRAQIFFKPEEVKAAIVTCGGLCPGLNDVIRQIVITMESGYGCNDIVGIPYGYRGFFEPGLEARAGGGSALCSFIHRF